MELTDSLIQGGNHSDQGEMMYMRQNTLQGGTSPRCCGRAQGRAQWSWSREGNMERGGLRGALKMWAGLNSAEKNREVGEGTSCSISQGWLHVRITLGNFYKIPKSRPTSPPVQPDTQPWTFWQAPQVILMDSKDWEPRPLILCSSRRDGKVYSTELSFFFFF